MLSNPLKQAQTIVVALSVIMLLSLCSCKMEDSYKEFELKNVPDGAKVNYFTSDEFSFARIASVVIIPQIREINHGEYIVYITAMSEAGTESVTIKNCTLEAGPKKLLECDLNTEMMFEEKQSSLYESWIEGGTFVNTDVAVGETYAFTVQAECEIDGVSSFETLCFEFVVKGYKSFVTPT